MGVDAVQNHGQAGRKQQSDRARRCDQAEGEIFREPRAQQHGQQQTAERKDRDPAGPRKRREESENQRSENRRSAGHPTHQGPEDADQSGAGAAFRQQIASQGEQGNGGKQRRGGQPVRFDRHRGGWRSLAPEKQQREPAQRRKNGQSQQRGGQKDECSRRNQTLGRQPVPETQQERNQHARTRRQSSGPTCGRIAHDAPHYNRQAHRHHRHHWPRRKAKDQLAACLALGPHDPEARPRQSARHRNGQRAGEQPHPSPRGRGQETHGGQRQQTVRARRQGRSEESHAQSEVLHDGCRARHSASQELAREDLGQRQGRHQGKRCHRQQGFDARRFCSLPRSSHQDFFPRWARNSSRKRFTSSNSSAGTRRPRSFG
jgi:hypothetical protein